MQYQNATTLSRLVDVIFICSRFEFNNITFSPFLFVFTYFISVFSAGRVNRTLASCPQNTNTTIMQYPHMEPVRRIERPSSAWKAVIIAIIRHRHYLMVRYSPSNSLQHYLFLAVMFHREGVTT